jgi:hypothetical protein
MRVFQFDSFTRNSSIKAFRSGILFGSSRTMSKGERRVIKNEGSNSEMGY